MLSDLGAGEVRILGVILISSLGTSLRAVVPDVLGIDLGSTGLEPLGPEEVCDLPLAY